MLKYVYPRIWPIAFLVFGLLAATGTHIHYSVGPLNIASHNLMWFMMALAHADVFWRPREAFPRPDQHH
ncbi:MAG: hypothetical protein OXP28_16630 [Gammaproteobacteria bacterium]|nr:hypothetical protein [Gammaproteobacteria bacterium]MDE0226736.1 hypothetical protein [Gammaproteobacteria bacterium]MDE0452205.1 hypothetical protein [Gammaproteobacteria bacterium]